MRLSLLSFCLCMACAPFPDIEGAAPGTSPSGPYPTLVPIETILASRRQAAGSLSAPLDARIAALNARAARLRGPVIGSATRARMARGVGL